ncbi:hypothetical protein RIF29_30028 [Crotalaria pallida]|uniref:Uncharacterized protein n=1 Tax=Crotalaria pallida TaxID=3830 RepID=A0AAN9EFL0_CROPI
MLQSLELWVAHVLSGFGKGGVSLALIPVKELEVSTRSKRSRLSADLFGSVCYTFQRGKFTKDFGDLTRDFQVFAKELVDQSGAADNWKEGNDMVML